MNRIVLALSCFALVACQNIDVKPGSERLRVFEAEPKGCLYMGEISSVQEDHLAPPIPAEIEMGLNTRNDLRNKAFAINGNIIVFANKNKKGSVDSGKKAAPEAKPATAAAPAPPPPTSGEPDTSEKKIITVFLATVFRCPASIFNQ